MSKDELWGTETKKAVENFPVSGERVPRSVIRWLGRIKAAAARTKPRAGKRRTRARPGTARARRRR